MILFCPKCENMIKNFKRGTVVNGKFIEDSNGKMFGICINEHFTECKESETLIKFNHNKKYPIDEEIIVKKEDKNLIFRN